MSTKKVTTTKQQQPPKPVAKTTTKGNANVKQQTQTNNVAKKTTNNNNNNNNNKTTTKTVVVKEDVNKKRKQEQDNKKKVDLKKKKKQQEEEEEEEENIYGIVYSEDEQDDSDDDDDSVDSDEQDSDSDDQDNSDFEEFNAGFDIGTVNEKDYHSIKAMLARLIPWKSETKFNAGEITDLIIDQCNKTKFGRAIRIEHNDDPYGFASVLSYKKYSTNDAVKGFVQYILEKLKTSESQHIDTKIHKKQQSVVDIVNGLLKESLSKTSKKDSSVGIVFSERFLNIPYQLIHPLHQYLQWDIELLNEQGITNDFKFDNYLILTSYGVTANTKQDQQLETKTSLKTSKQQPKKKTKKEEQEEEEEEEQQKLERNQVGQCDYFKAEDEFFKKYSSMWSTFDIPYEYKDEDETSKWTMGGNLHRKGLIIVLPTSKIQSFLDDIKEEFK
ncbi:hypothetical protein DFA_10870 [Cavenderia fasciculata]|uniref:Uncharacterized protein n=1 Tax=Cavenderia fasciculata TaxID=261658 RepID=F4QBM4_CACFS|nr:uncharacterized protein DFA_10870 [Cavenderia fasciculata]EGG14612.1 hypothetical protein DFA_10870 [Cavenderia fasciculata]|eukprot:XP_004351120.1 hypothetical protein DFA_10870 [Cavenderia fasciculata]